MLTEPLTPDKGFVMEYGGVVRLMWPLVTGIEVKIENEWDWVVFGDVFVNREYPIYFRMVDKTKVVTIVDLGANVGYFSLYAANECRKVQQPCKILAFEGNFKTCDILTERTKQCPEITTHFGLVGKKSGTELITDSANHSTSQVLPLSENQSYPTISSFYVDLEQFLVNQTVDILKCDIEGSEFDLVNNYPELLKRTHMVYMEIHSTCGDVKALKDKMLEYGFTSNFVLLNRSNCTVEVFYRA